MSEAQKTKDHNRIREWVQERGGYPATVAETKVNGDAGLLRIDFPNYTGSETLERISWDDFFEKFDLKDLTFLHQEITEQGAVSRFCKFIDED